MLAFVLVELDAECRKPGEEAEDGAHGTNRVAVGSAIEEGQHTEDEHHHPGDDRKGDVAHIEAGDDATVVTVRLKQGGHWYKTENEADDEYGTDGIA